MDIIQQLQNDQRFYAQCPRCMGEFPLHQAFTFHLNEPLPPPAMMKLKARTALLADRCQAMRKARRLAQVNAEITTESVNLGKILEKIAPSFPSFGFAYADCRALFEPIDYLIFSGLSTGAGVAALIFVDVKSGKGRLSQVQRSIREIVMQGKIELQRLTQKQEV